MFILLAIPFVFSLASHASFSDIDTGPNTQTTAFSAVDSTPFYNELEWGDVPADYSPDYSARSDNTFVGRNDHDDDFGTLSPSHSFGDLDSRLTPLSMQNSTPTANSSDIDYKLNTPSTSSSNNAVQSDEESAARELSTASSGEMLTSLLTKRQQTAAAPQAPAAKRSSDNFARNLLNQLNENRHNLLTFQPMNSFSDHPDAYRSPSPDIIWEVPAAPLAPLHRKRKF